MTTITCFRISSNLAVDLLLHPLKSELNCALPLIDLATL